MNWPKEPSILLSFINMKLRDNYSSLQDMCEDLDMDMQTLLEELKAAGLSYDEANNRLRD